MQRALFALGGLAGGLVLSLAIVAAIDKPGQMLTEAKARIASLEKEKAALETSLGETDAARSAAEAALSDARGQIDEKQKMLDEFESATAKVAAGLRDMEARNLRLYPTLRQYKRFQVKIAGIDKSSRRPIDKWMAGKFEQTVTERIDALGVPTASDSGPDVGELLFALNIAPAQWHMAASVDLVVPAAAPDGSVVYLFSQSDVVASDGGDDLFRDLVLTIDNVALAFKKKWAAQ